MKEEEIKSIAVNVVGDSQKPKEIGIYITHKNTYKTIRFNPNRVELIPDSFGYRYICEKFSNNEIPMEESKQTEGWEYIFLTKDEQTLIQYAQDIWDRDWDILKSHQTLAYLFRSPPQLFLELLYNTNFASLLL